MKYWEWKVCVVIGCISRLLYCLKLKRVTPLFGLGQPTVYVNQSIADNLYAVVWNQVEQPKDLILPFILLQSLRQLPPVATSSIIYLNKIQSFTRMQIHPLLAIASVAIDPVCLDCVDAALLAEGSRQAAAVGEKPLDVVEDGEEGLDQKLAGAVDGDDDQHPLAVVLRPRARLVDHHVHVDHDVGEQAVVEKPRQEGQYQLETKKTFSVSYFLPPWAEVDPLVPQETSSTLQKAWATIVCAQAPWQARQLIWSLINRHTNPQCVGRCMNTTRQNIPRFTPHITRILIWLKFVKSMPVVPSPRQIPRMLQVTSPHIANVNSESTEDMTWACFAHTAPVSPPATATRQTMTQRMETILARTWQRALCGSIWAMVSQRMQKQREGVRQLVRKERRASTMERLSLTYLSKKPCLDSIELKQQFFQTQRKANRLLLIHRRRCFIRFQWSFIGSVFAIASGTYFRQYLDFVWQQMPSDRMRSSAKYILASRQSFSSMSGFRIILKQLCSSRFGSYSSDLMRALQRQADQAPGRTCRKPSAPSAFLSRKWAMIYSYSCAFSMEKKESLMHFTRQFSSSSSFSLSLPSPPSSDSKFESTLISPVTPPTSSSVKPLSKLTTPLSSGLVPTSSKTMNSGLRYLQKPSKNHRWEDSLVPFKCLKQEKILRYLSSFLLFFQGSFISFYLYWGVLVMEGRHRFWQRREMFFSMDWGKSRLLAMQLAMPLRLQLSISSRITLMRSSRSHLGLPSNQSSLRQNSTIELSPSTQVRLLRLPTSLRMPSCMRTTATSSEEMPCSSRLVRLSQMPSRVRLMALRPSLYMQTQMSTLILMPLLLSMLARLVMSLNWQMRPSSRASSRRQLLSGQDWSKILLILFASTGPVQAHIGMLLWSMRCWNTRGEKNTFNAGYFSRQGSSRTTSPIYTSICIYFKFSQIKFIRPAIQKQQM